jgi:hypothetical protein
MRIAPDKGKLLVAADLVEVIYEGSIGSVSV